MKVFLSSVIAGFEPYREAAARAALALRHDVRRAEEFPASPESPQQACLAGVRWADVVILIIGARYGALQKSGLSATHEEYREARGRRQVLAFIEHAVEREPAQKIFEKEVRDWVEGVYTADFSSADELRDAVVRALHEIEICRVVATADEGEMLARATALMPADRGSSEASIAIVVVGGPRQSILRPAELARAELEKALAQEALFGPAGIFDRGAGTQHSIQDDALVIEQQRASILLDQLGSIRVIQPARAPRRQGTTVDLPVLIEEEINGLIAHGLGFIEWVLQRVDPVGRISDVVPLVALMGGLGWRTAAENRRDPHSMPMRMTQGAVVVTLTPARRFRTALAHEREIWAEDFTALLARRMR